MRILTNRANGQTLETPFEVSDFNIQGEGAALQHVAAFADTYLTVNNPVAAICREEESDADQLGDAIAELSNLLEQLNPALYVSVDLENFCIEINSIFDEPQSEGSI